jgi:zinc transport system permease protein
VVLLVSIGLMPQLFAVSADEPFARTIGLPTRWLNILVVALAAITVTVSMRTVGLLLVSALMVVPVATATQVATGFRVGLFASMGVGAVAAVSGTIGSYYLNTAPGALIVVIAILLFAASWPFARLLQGRPDRPIEVGSPDDVPPEQVAEPHSHVHGPDCEHPAVEHAGHIDYVHDGHRHAPHGDHYDEH